MKKSFLISFFLLLLTLASCRKDELYAPQQHGVGMIELMLDGEDGICIEETTKSNADADKPDFGDLSFVLTDTEGQTQTVAFTPGQDGKSGSALVPTGTYTLTIKYQKDGEACWEGVSGQFTVERSETVAVSVQMHITNARIVVSFGTSLDEFYQSVSFTFSDGKSSVTVPYEQGAGEKKIYFPAGSQISYTLNATRRSDTGAKNIINLPFEISSTLEKGKSYPVSLNVRPGGDINLSHPSPNTTFTGQFS